MAEYVNKQLVVNVNSIIKKLIRENKPIPPSTLVSISELLEYLPTADVVEVKHGEWIDRYNNKYANHLYICSVCGGEALYEFYVNELGQTKERQALTVGCPHCLAKMDKRSGDNV